MIPRVLVPRDARPAAAPSAPPLRLNTLLDDRVVLAANLPHVPLETRTAIPLHMPLDVLASRVVVPRDMPQAPLDAASVHPGYAPVTKMDRRITVPMGMPVVELAPKPVVPIQDLPKVLDPDVLNTGEVNLMVAPVEKPSINWNWVARTGSIAIHAAFISLLLLQPKLFPYRPPTDQEVEIARKQLNFIYMPPDVRGLPPEPPRSTGPPIRVDPRVLREAAPPEPAPKQPEPAPEESATASATPPRPITEPESRSGADLPRALPNIPRETAPRETVQSKPQPESPTGLVLPRMNSPGRTLEQSAQQAVRGGGGLDISGGSIPGRGGSGVNDGYAGAGIQMLTPTEGVDFSSYLARVLASVKRSWYSVMPESARLGDQGRVVLQFRIMRDGGVPPVEPQLAAGSGKEPLDRAAIAAIRSSSPFGPLPAAFSGPYVELRFIFLYNLPLDYQ